MHNKWAPWKNKPYGWVDGKKAVATATPLWLLLNSNQTNPKNLWKKWIRLMTRTSCVLFPPPSLPPLPPQEPVFSSPPWSLAAWRWSSLSLWPPVRSCVTSSSTWQRFFGLLSCCTKGPWHWKKHLVKKKKDNTHTHTQTFYPVSFVWISLFLQSRLHFWRRPYRGGCLHLIFLSSLPLKSLISGSQQFVLFALVS